MNDEEYVTLSSPEVREVDPRVREAFDETMAEVGSPPRAYEGYAKLADGSVISLQCQEGRCGSCPDGHDSEASDRSPTLGIYYCEHGCRGVDQPNAKPDRNEDCLTLDKIQEILRDPDWGVGMLEDIGDLVGRTGRSIEDYPDGRSTWERH